VRLQDGKAVLDRVASSNLARSSKKEPTPLGVGSFFAAPDLKDQIATVRWTVAGEGSTEPNLYFHSHWGMKMQTNLASSSKKQSTHSGRLFFYFYAVSQTASFHEIV